MIVFLLFLVALLKYGPRNAKLMTENVLYYLSGEQRNLSSIWRTAVINTTATRNVDSEL
jgi:hypothetical protein